MKSTTQVLLFALTLALTTACGSEKKNPIDSRSKQSADSVQQPESNEPGSARPGSSAGSTNGKQAASAPKIDWNAYDEDQQSNIERIISETSMTMVIMAAAEELDLLRIEAYKIIYLIELLRDLGNDTIHFKSFTGGEGTDRTPAKAFEMMTKLLNAHFPDEAFEPKKYFVDVQESINLDLRLYLKDYFNFSVEAKNQAEGEEESRFPIAENHDVVVDRAALDKKSIEELKDYQANLLLLEKNYRSLGASTGADYGQIVSEIREAYADSVKLVERATASQ